MRQKVFLNEISVLPIRIIGDCPIIHIPLVLSSGSATARKSAPSPHTLNHCPVTQYHFVSINTGADRGGEEVHSRGGWEMVS